MIKGGQRELLLIFSTLHSPVCPKAHQSHGQLARPSRGYIGIMENEMETSIEWGIYWGHIGVIYGIFWDE